MNMPKTQAECKSSEPVEVSRKLRTACALMSEVVELSKANAHYDPNFRLKDSIDATFSRMPVLPKAVLSRIVICF